MPPNLCEIKMPRPSPKKRARRITSRCLLNRNVEPANFKAETIVAEVMFRAEDSEAGYFDGAGHEGSIFSEGKGGWDEVRFP